LTPQDPGALSERLGGRGFDPQDPAHSERLGGTMFLKTLSDAGDHIFKDSSINNTHTLSPSATALH